MYTIERADLVAEQLRRFTSGYAHHVAGHFANLDFWLDEAEGALRAIDGHNDRFATLKAAQAGWVDRHQTTIPSIGFCPLCGGECEFSKMVTPRPPKIKATSAKQRARRNLVDAVYYFLARGCRMGLLSEREMRVHCDRFDASIDPKDLRRG